MIPSQFFEFGYLENYAKCKSLSLSRSGVGKAELCAISGSDLEDDDRLNQIQNSSRMVFDSLSQIISKQSDMRRENLSQKRRKIQPQESLVSERLIQGLSNHLNTNDRSHTDSSTIHLHSVYSIISKNCVWGLYC
jgi:hypothetical protein